MSYLRLFKPFAEQTKSYSGFLKQIADDMTGAKKLHMFSSNLVRVYVGSAAETIGKEKAMGEPLDILREVLSAPFEEFIRDPFDYIYQHSDFAIERFYEASKNLQMLPNLIRLASGSLLSEQQRKEMLLATVNTKS